MLQRIRDRAQGIGAKIIVGLIALTFTLFGAESLVGYFGGGGENDAATVNGESISQQTLETELQRAVRSGRIPPEQQNQAQQEILDSLIVREVVDQYAREGGMSFSEQQIDQLLVNRQEFQDSQGRFSPDIFRQRLSSAGYTPQSFREQLDEDMLTQQLQDGLIAATFILPSEAQQLAELRFQQRSFRYTQLSDEDLESAIEVSEVDMRDWYEAHRSRYQRPEQVRLAWVELDRRQLPATDRAVDERQLQQAYEQRRAAAPREVSDIVVQYGSDRSREEAQARVEEIRARLEQGDSFGELAEQYSDDPATASQGGSLGTVSEGIFGDAFDRAVASTQPGEVTTVEDGNLFHVLRVDSVAIPPLEELRAELTEEIQQQQSHERFQELAQQLGDESFSADNLEDVAQRLGLALNRSDWLTRDASDAQQSVLAEPGVMEAAFSDDVLEEGYNSEVIELGDDRRLVVRVIEHRDAEILAFEEVEGQVREAVRASQRDRALAALAEERVRQLRQGETPAGLDWREAENVTRDASSQLAPALVSAAFTMPAPAEGMPGYGHESIDGEQVIFAIENVSADPTQEELSGLTESLWSARARQSVGAFTDTLRENAEVSTR